MDQEEREIVDAFKNRDAKAFAHIFRMNRKPLVYFAEKILGIREEAEDIVADSFMKLWNRHADFENLRAIKSFLYIITRNACLNFLKYSKRISANQKEYSYWADNNEAEIVDILFTAELLGDLDKEIEALSPGCRKVFRLSFCDGFNTNEIAAKLGISPQTVRNQKTKAIQFIRTEFFKRHLLDILLVYLSLCLSRLCPVMN